MKIFSESDYSDIAIGIIKNYEENKKESIRKLDEKKNLLFHSNSHFNDSLFSKKESYSNENKLLRKSIDNNDDSSYNSLVDDFYDKAIKKYKKSKKKSTNFSESDNDNTLVSESHIIKKDENKLLIKKKVIQRNNEILKKNHNKPLMPLLKKKNTKKKMYIKNKKTEQVNHKNEWNSNQNDLDKYKLSKEELEQKKNNLKSKNLDKVKMEYKEKLKQMRQKHSLVTSRCKENDNYEEEKNNSTKLNGKKKEKTNFKKLMENINLKEINQNLINKKNEIKPNNKKNNFKCNNIKKCINSQKIEKENTIGVNDINNVNVSHDMHNNENYDSNDCNHFDIDCVESSLDDMKNSKKHIYQKINKKKEKNNNNHIKLKKSKIKNNYKACALKKSDEMSKKFLNYINDSDSYASSILNILDYKREFNDNYYLPRNKQIYNNKDFLSLKKKKLNNLDNIKKELFNSEVDNDLSTTYDFSSDKTTMDYFVKELKNHNENLCIDINPNNIKMNIENYKIEKKMFEEKKYYPNIEFNFYENISTKSSCSSNYDCEYIFDSDYSEHIKKLNDNFIQNDNILKLKKNKMETFNHIKKIMLEIKNIDYKNVNILRSYKNEIEKKDDYVDMMINQKENNRLYCIDSEKLGKKENHYNIKIGETEKKDYYEHFDEKIEKTKVYPLMELLFKEDEDDYYLKEKSNEYYKEEENIIFNENKNLYKEEGISNNYIFNDSEHNSLYQNINSSNMKNSSKIKRFSVERSNNSKNEKLNGISSFSSSKNSFYNNLNTSREYSYNLSKIDHVKRSIESEKSSYNSNSSTELVNKMDSKSNNSDKNIKNTFDNYRDYLKKSSNDSLIFLNDKEEKNCDCDSLKNILLSRSTKKSNRNDEKNKDIKKKVDRRDSNIIKNEMKYNCSKFNMDNKSTQLKIPINDMNICEVSNKIIKKCDEQTISNVSNTDLYKKERNNIFNKKNVNNTKNAKKEKNRREIEYSEKYMKKNTEIKNSKDTVRIPVITKTSKDITGLAKNHVNKRTKKLFSANKDNEITSTKKEGGKEDICSNKEYRLINQKILNTSLNFEDTHNLSDDDKFIFDTYLKEENTKKKEENLSEIINSQVKAFEQIFL
ncbi:conserved Plasmodium protein, unknown function [Plasmodium relictum]|uniref:Coiled-coil domain-containing protein 52 n=1 Tax=Plasmodium relictum TaxID=85471 RepID=A0A1J1H7T4_PLARL|nr:conserved Plasmodium protein, unknown function [Plasmodium relictum]CRG99479.1 conserved Plasmodium protein, unknown function [Plasmodium relictum]